MAHTHAVADKSQIINWQEKNVRKYTLGLIGCCLCALRCCQSFWPRRLLCSALCQFFPAASRELLLVKVRQAPARLDSARFVCSLGACVGYRFDGGRGRKRTLRIPLAYCSYATCPSLLVEASKRIVACLSYSLLTFPLIFLSFPCLPYFLSFICTSAVRAH